MCLISNQHKNNMCHLQEKKIFFLNKQRRHHNLCFKIQILIVFILQKLPYSCTCLKLTYFHFLKCGLSFLFNITIIIIVFFKKYTYEYIHLMILNTLDYILHLEIHRNLSFIFQCLRAIGIFTLFLFFY